MKSRSFKHNQRCILAKLENTILHKAMWYTMFNIFICQCKQTKSNVAPVNIND